MKLRRSKALPVLLLLALVGTACRDNNEVTAEGGDGEIRTDVGVTAEPCPGSPNPDNGCIYLGIISDLTSPNFAALAIPLTRAQEAFWAKVNAEGGIGGYDIDVKTYQRDNKYNPQEHRARYDEIAPRVLALAQTLGSPTTMQILRLMKDSNVLGVPAGWTSAWNFEDVILEVGANYCFESMNAVDYAVRERNITSVMAVHYPGDYGDDAAGGVRIAAEAHGLAFTNVQTVPGQDNQAEAISRIASVQPDLVILTTGPIEAAVIIGQSHARGFRGSFIGTSPTWNPGLLQNPAAPAILAQYLQSAPWAPWGSDTPGHQAMRDALGANFTPNDGAVAGWVWSYPMKAAIEAAIEAGDLTRAGLLRAANDLASVDFEGMLPSEAGNYAAEPNDGAFRQNVITRPAQDAPTGVTMIEDFFVGDTARDFTFEKPCF